MQLDEINDLDLSYTPPLSSPWEPVQMAAQVWNAEGIATRRCSAESPAV